MTFGEKLKKARQQAGYTQEELSNIMTVSRAAVAKWESDRGMPDVSNLKRIAAILDVSVDYLLDEGVPMYLNVTKKPIDLEAFRGGRKLTRRRILRIKERILRETYPNAEIVRLALRRIRNSRRETATEQLIGWVTAVLGTFPLFSVVEVSKLVNSLDHQYYLVNEGDRQYFVTITDEYLTARAQAAPITARKFEIGDRTFLAGRKVR